MAEDDRLDPQGETARAAGRRLAVRLRERRLQSDPVAEGAAEDGLMRATCVDARGHRPHEGPRGLSCGRVLNPRLAAVSGRRSPWTIFQRLPSWLETPLPTARLLRNCRRGSPMRRFAASRPRGATGR